MTPAELARDALQALFDDRRTALGSSHRKRIAAALTALIEVPWPAGCHDPDSCYRHQKCMYIRCRHEGATLTLTRPASNSEAK